MIATDKFVFAHLPRSGGTFVTGIINKIFSAACEIGHHLPRESCPKKKTTSPRSWGRFETLGNSTFHCITMCGPKMPQAYWSPG